METILADGKTVGELVAERPSRSRVFERLGIDYCCGGKLSLAEAGARRGLSVEELIRAVAEHDQAAPAEERDWTQASLTELADHIEATHHAYLRDELPRLGLLAAKVADVHGGEQPHLRDINGVFVELRAELESHMMKEEHILFPICRQLDRSAGPQAFHCGSVANPIRVMEHEHDNAGRALEQLRELTAGYQPPQSACNSYRALYDGLATLEQDLHQHIHKENNILFPRAIAAEAG